MPKHNLIIPIELPSEPTRLPTEKEVHQFVKDTTRDYSSSNIEAVRVAAYAKDEAEFQKLIKHVKSGLWPVFYAAAFTAVSFISAGVSVGLTAPLTIALSIAAIVSVFALAVGALTVLSQKKSLKNLQDSELATPEDFVERYTQAFGLTKADSSSAKLMIRLHSQGTGYGNIAMNTVFAAVFVKTVNHVVALNPKHRVEEVAKKLNSLGTVFMLKGRENHNIDIQPGQNGEIIVTETFPVLQIERIDTNTVESHSKKYSTPFYLQSITTYNANSNIPTKLSITHTMDSGLCEALRLSGLNDENIATAHTETFKLINDENTVSHIGHLKSAQKLNIHLVAGNTGETISGTDPFVRTPIGAGALAGAGAGSGAGAKACETLNPLHQIDDVKNQTGSSEDGSRTPSPSSTSTGGSV